MAPVRLCHVPIRVRSTRGPAHLHRLHTYSGPGGIPHDFRARGQSTEGRGSGLGTEATRLAGEDAAPERGGEQRFVINMGSEHVMTVHLSQKVYTCGECVVAVLDFSGAERLCKMVVLSLESHETLLMKSEHQALLVWQPCEECATRENSQV